MDRTRATSHRGQTAAELLLIILGSFMFILIVTSVLRATILNPTQAQVNTTQTGSSGFNQVVPTGNQACAITAASVYLTSAGGPVVLTATYSNLVPASQQVTVNVAGTPLVLSGCASASGTEKTCSNSFAFPPNAGTNPVTYQVSSTIGTTVCRPTTVVVAPPSICAQSDQSCGATGACTDCTVTYQCYNSTHRTNTGTCVASACNYAGAVACPNGFTCTSNTCQQPTGSPSVTLNSPADAGSGAANQYTAFTFTPQDDYAFSNGSVWTNFTGAWARSGLNTSQLFNNSQYSISLLVPNAKASYIWTAQVCDDNVPDVCVFNNTNRTLVVDLLGAHVNVSDAVGVQSRPDVAYNTVGDEFLVVYESNQSHSNGNNFELYAARHSPADGSQQATPTALTSGGTHNTFTASTAYVNTSNRVIALINSNYSNGLTALTINAATAALATGETVVQTASGVSINTGWHVAANRDRDEFAVFWADDSAAGVTHGYFKILRASDLATVVAKTQVATGNGSSGVNAKAVVYDNTTREYTFIWQQPMGGSSPAYSTRRANAAGVLQGTQANIQTDSSNMANRFAAVYNYKRDEIAVFLLNGTGPWVQRLYGLNATPGGLAPASLGVGAGYVVNAISYNPWANEYLTVFGSLAKRVSDTSSVPSTNVTVFSSARVAPVLFTRATFATSATAANRNHFAVADSGEFAPTTCSAGYSYYCTNTIGQLVYG